jgi:formate dehydrogenase maturation protein FdhE
LERRRVLQHPTTVLSENSMSTDHRAEPNTSGDTTDEPPTTSHTARTIYGEPYRYFRCSTCGDEWTDARVECETCQ